MSDLIWVALSLIPAYGIGRFIRYQRWSPEPKGKWRMYYERRGQTWKWKVVRDEPWAWEIGEALTYRSAVRRSRRVAFLEDASVTITYEVGK